MSIHPTSIIGKRASIGNNVKIGPYCVVGDSVVLHDNVELVSHVCIDGKTEVGDGSIFYPFSSIGFPPQDLKFHGEDSKVVIGKNNSIREYVTIQPGTEGGIMKTVVGDNCLLMANTHVAHDCIVGNNVIMANCATLAGHVTVGDHAVFGGLSAVHQWVRVGEYAMVGGMCGVERDVIPFGSVQGNRAELHGLNILGLKRKGATLDEISCLKKIYNSIFETDGVFAEKIQSLEKEDIKYLSARSLIAFLKDNSRRSFCGARGLS